jgi:hypothetical protein
MRKPITPRRTKPPACQLCGDPLETAATVQNSSATIRPNGLARCSSCLILYTIDADLRPSPVFDDAPIMNADPETKKWAMKTLEAVRIRAAAEIKAECVAAREWLIARGDPGLVDDLATLDAYAAGFDEKGITSATSAVRRRASGILAQLRHQTRH